MTREARPRRAQGECVKVLAALKSWHEYMDWTIWKRLCFTYRNQLTPMADMGLTVLMISSKASGEHARCWEEWNEWVGRFS